MTTIIQITDLHIPDINEITYDIDVKKNLTHTIQTIRNEVFDILIVTGDIAFKRANTHSYEFAKQSMQYICNSLYILGGNHDKIELLQEFFPNSFPHNSTYYKIPNRDSTILCLDRSSSKINQQQLDWLQFELSHSQNVNIFIHHPILPTQVAYMESKYSLHCR
ncbi:MAG TPA: metallophosphoesterase, partial [Bacteroidales bacterium]|nr:metallophosphoesterase [Bacteroidales bacterium]